MGDLGTTRQWYEQYGEAVHRRCTRLLGDQALAWDLTQEVFIRAHDAAARFRGETSVLSWLLTIADRRCFTEIKRRRGQSERLSELALEPRESEDFERLFTDDDLVRRLLEHFDEEVQAIVVKRFFDEMEQEEIALALGISRKTVHRKLERFFESAQKILAQLARPRQEGS